ncbi:hypothetical protein P280DRAFT_503906 [Massarina eburnea CBS 473.64]|uniref:Uncharacterized protein n=1 Tax=Massarina eburnea CBS 473.64 TaxID=1395130 RepID=A0A6A6SG33_9PLEO|nr:hypothetical protein P280DRAFT_503906 [Massarina eburnea CBS 473.64]
MSLMSMFFPMVCAFALTVLSKGTSSVCGAAGVSVRLPDVRSAENQSWELPPEDFYFQPWFMTHTSYAANLGLINYQYDPYPMEGYGTDFNDLFSFQTPNNSKIYPAYGIDTPTSPSKDVVEYRGTGLLAADNSTFIWLAWGCDTTGTPYYLNYATASTHTTAGMDIMSTKEEGMDQATYDALLDGLIALGDDYIIAVAKNLTKTVQDGGRRGLPRVTTCDEQCRTNEQLRPIIGGRS